MCYNKKSKGGIFAVIGIIVTAVAAAAGIAYLIYRFMNRHCIESDECYEFDCGDCTSDDCENCPVAAEFAAEDIQPDDQANAKEEADGEE